jgi:P-type Cu2+ transporter
MSSAAVADELRAADLATQACAHCGEPLPLAAGRFCCSGCAAAFHLVEELGLARYYEGRRLDPTLRLPRPPEEPEADWAACAEEQADGTASLHLMIDGLHCAACVWLIESALRRQSAVLEARVNLTTRRLQLLWRGTAADAAPLVGRVQRLGYRVVAYDPQRVADLASQEERRLLRALSVAGFAAGNVMLLSIAVWSGAAGEMGEATRDFLHWISALIALPAVAYAGQPFFRAAWSAVRHGRTTMDVPIAIGVILATAMSLYETIAGGTHAYFDSAVMLLFFLLVGRYLDLRARGRARSAAQLLLGLAGQSATVIGAGGEAKRVSASAVSLGDTVLVAAGERIVIDGRVAEGRSAIDRSLIDGESLPADVSPGADLLAGTLNLTAPLRVTVTATGERTFIAEIVRLMEAAEQGRARLVLLADRVARLYAPVVHVLALATFAAWAIYVPWQQALLTAVAVLIITCPCALGLAVPAVQVVAGGMLMRRGILLKSATALERLAAVDTVVFDKTGTLTLGRLELQPAPAPDAHALCVAASLAAASRHPLSRALCRACPDVPVLDGVSEHPGVGVAAASPEGELRLGSRAFCGVAAGEEDGRTELFLTRPGHPPARFVFTDTLRSDAAAVVGQLRQHGMRVVLLSGDRAPVVAQTAAMLGISEWRGGVAPDAKCAVLAALAADGCKTLMVGDGLNDAPALAAAHVSMSPATAADVSQTAADMVFQRASLGAVLEALDTARLSGRLIRENIAFAVAYNALAVPLAMLGWATPLIAAIAMSSSSLIVVGNALRLSWRSP